MPYILKRILIGVGVAVGTALVITFARVAEVWPS